MADKKLKFEDGMAELEGIVERIEMGELPLEETIEGYERGFKLIKELEKMLKLSQGKIEKLTKSGGRVPLEEEDADA